MAVSQTYDYYGLDMHMVCIRHKPSDLQNGQILRGWHLVLDDFKSAGSSERSVLSRSRNASGPGFRCASSMLGEQDYDDNVLTI
jgi:hypothetical protein